MGLYEIILLAVTIADIHGIVKTGDGVPIANVRVTARTGANTEHDAVTDQRGAFRIQGIAAGSWYLSTGGAEIKCDATSGQDSQCDIVVVSLGVIDSATVSELPVN